MHYNKAYAFLIYTTFDAVEHFGIERPQFNHPIK